MIDALRRQEIRSRVAAKRDAAVQLQSQLTDAYLNAQITLWCNWLTDVEQLFLDDIDEARTADAEARWLDAAQNYCGMAQDVLRQVEQIVAKYDPGAISVQTFGGRKTHTGGTSRQSGGDEEGENTVTR
jgi:hypothetical protein